MDSQINTTLTHRRSKPRLLFFRFRYGHDVPAFILGHAAEQVRCLERWFDVTLVQRDCDFQQVVRIGRTRSDCL